MYTRFDAFSDSYFTARQRFVKAAAECGATVENHQLHARGPGEQPLFLDTARLPVSGPTSQLLLVSSGLHGVEGFFGSAVQQQWLQRFGCSDRQTAVVFLHALNPYGFAHARRVNEDNADPNRGFLLESEHYDGAPGAYAALDPLLNPARPPALLDELQFYVEAYALIHRLGLAAVSQAVAQGQYEYPKGLFYGGNGASESTQIIAKHMSRWCQGARNIIHIDLHTGLGAHGRLTLVSGGNALDNEAAWFRETFPNAHISSEEGTEDTASYQARGSLGPWCAQQLEPDVIYRYVCAEAGTYGPVRVLAALRAENQAHHYSPPCSPAFARAKRRLLRNFCPSSKRWRCKTLEAGLALLLQAERALEKSTLPA